MATKVGMSKVDELIRCGKDPNYFIETYCRIERDGLIPFQMWDFQKRCIEDFLAYQNNIVLKSRQIGMSTVTAAYATWMFLFRPHSNILVIATKLATAKLFIRKVKTVIKHLPDWMKIWQVTAETQQGIELDQGSIIKAVPTGDDVGRGEALSLLVIDEAAFIKNFEELWTGLKPTMSSTGGKTIILSTPNGVGNMYHKIWDNSAKKDNGEAPGSKGKNTFNGIKLSWQVVPERDQEWFDRESLDMSPRAIAQELECDFVSSGDNVIDENTMRWLRQTVKPPRERMGYDRCLWVWERPKYGHSYLISADVSRGDSKDFSTAHIIDIGEGEVVAEYQGKSPPDRFAELLNEVGRKYNNALLCPEKNTYGYATLMRLRDLGYPNIYFKHNNAVFVSDFVYEEDIAKAGFDTNVKSRSAAIAKLEEVLRNKMIKIYSDRFVSELQTFIWHYGKDNVSAKAKAMKSYNDDLVMSMAIGTWLWDASEYSKESMDNTNIIFDAMGVQSTQVEDVKTAEVTTRSDYNIWAPSPGGSSVGITKKGFGQGRLGKEWKWLTDD